MDGQPEHDPADTLGPALAVILGTLPPPARIAYVLHDVFGVPYELIAAVLGRSAASTRALAAHARKRVRAGRTPSGTVPPTGTPSGPPDPGAGVEA